MSPTLTLVVAGQVWFFVLTFLLPTVLPSTYTVLFRTRKADAPRKVKPPSPAWTLKLPEVRKAGVKSSSGRSASRSVTNSSSE